MGVATDAAGDVYVADGNGNNRRIQKFDSDGNFLTKWGSFSAVRGLTTDAAGNVYVADNDRIQKFSSNGGFLTQWGSFGGGDGQIRQPFGIATDADGGVYVADTGNHRIQKFGSNGAFLGKWGASGSGDGEFFSPFGIGTAATGDIYVADSGNSRIQKFTLTRPGTEIDSGPNGPTGDATPTFNFSSDDTGATFECAIDEAEFGPCSGPAGSHTPASALDDGEHTFQARAIDDFGDLDLTPASQAFTVDTAAPETTLDVTPGDPDNDPTPSFEFSSDDEDASFECRLFEQGDPAPAFGDCSGPGDSHTPASALGDGEYTFEVRATDAAGNADLVPSSHGFEVDTLISGLTLEADDPQKQRGERIVVKAAVGAGEDLDVTLRGMVDIAGSAQEFALKPQEAAISPPTATQFKLKPRKKDTEKIATALKRDRKVEATLTLDASDVLGNQDDAERTVRLK